MNLRFASILHGDEERWPGHSADVVHLAGCPFNCPWCNTPSLVKSEGFDEKPVEYFLDELAGAEAVVVTGGEPLMQGNALLRLLQGLDAPARIETNGYYPETLNDCLPLASEVALDFKAALKPAEYKKASRFRGDPETLYSNVLRSLTFLEKNGSRVRKEFSFTVFPDTKTGGLAETASYVSLYCDEFVLRPFQPGNCLDSSFNSVEAPTTNKMSEALNAVRGKVRKAVIR